MAEQTITFRMRGSKELRMRLAKLRDEAPEAATRALVLESELIMTEAKKKTIPVDLGTLRASGKVQPPEADDALEVTFGFGDSSAPYALAVHEHPSDHSPPTWEGKEIKFSGTPRAGAGYLRRPMRQKLKGMLGRLSRRIAAETDL